MAFALDLTPEAVTLHERAGLGGWKKFASVQLDDPEFPMVIGLLRAEAEAQIGGRRPVRLWLPGEQVLQRRARIPDGPPAARQRAAFDYIERNTVYRPEDVAVAVAPADGGGETALLITFAATWREARDYAARWGFIPGEVSTRCQAEEFGPEGPVFQLNSPLPELSALPSARPRRSRLAVGALALAAVAAGAAVWSLQPRETPSARPGTALEVAEAPAPELPQAAPLPAPEPETRPESRPEARPEAPPPAHFARTPVLTPPGAAGHQPGIGAAPRAPSPPATPAVLTAPAALAAAPRPPPDPEPAPPERDPVTAWTGPTPVLEAPVLSSAPGPRAFSGGIDPPARADAISLLAKGASPPATPVAAPPAPEPAPPERDPVTAWTGPVPALEAPGLSSAPGPRAFSGGTDPPARIDAISLLAKGPSPPPVPIAAPPAPEPAPPERDPVTAWTGPVPALEAPGLSSAPGVRGSSGGMAPPARVDGISPLAKGPSQPPVPIAAPPAGPAPATVEVAAAASPVPIPLPRPAYTDPYAPTKFASLTSPLPKTRPVRAALPLARTALIGIHSLTTGRKALLRLANGGYRTVAVGDVVGGWRVSMIGADAMRVSRGGEDRTFALVSR